MSENTDKRTATQKIDDLEKVVTVLYQSAHQNKNAIEGMFPLRGDVALLKEALKILNKKTEAIIQLATPETGITSDAVSAVVVKMNVEDLKAQVAGYISTGHLAPTDTVAEDTYLVCEESDASGAISNPRIQFRIDSQDDETRKALLGKKVGDTVSFGENKLDAKILELYSVTEPKAPEAPAVEATAEATPEAPAETQAPAPEAAALTGPSNAALAAPTESPVVEFVPSQPGTMATAQ